MRTNIYKPGILLFLLCLSLFSQGLKHDPPRIHGFHSPFKSAYGSLLTDPNPRLLKLNSTLFSDTAIINFENRQITFLSRDSLGNSVWTYHYGEMNDYILAGRYHSFVNNWYRNLSPETRRAVTDKSSPKLQWELAVHYPPWAQRLLGKEPPRLTISGALEITIGYESQELKANGELLSDESRSSGLVFDNNYDFRINGSVGRLININITHSRNSGFDMTDDPLKNFKIEYKESTPGELEDEIIQEITAGYTDFSMPGTDLSGYSEKADGLFGIKLRSKFGPLMLTTIASHEQGEAISKELGGKNDPNNSRPLSELEIEENRYFFLDTLYRRFYNQKYNLQDPDNSEDPPQVKQLQVFRQISAGKNTNTRTYRAEVNGDPVDFELLRQDEHYYLDASEGWIRFYDSVRVSNDRCIAITMESFDGTIKKGEYVPPASSGNETMHSLSVLKPIDMDGMESREHEAFGLMWRNVYRLPGNFDAQKFKVEVYHIDPERPADTIWQNSEDKLLSDVLGLTRDGKPRLDRNDIFDIENGYLILPPYGPSQNGNEPFASPALGEMADSTIYNYGRTTTTITQDYITKFGMRMTGTSKSTTFDNLGWNIMEGTVVVKTRSGKVLEEGVDYALDYTMGVLELLSPAARSAESVTITYQRESDFVLEKKVFAGIRGEVKLPFISDNSFAAMNLLYQDVASSSNDIPQLENEPFSKLHLSFNTKLDFEPEWMTRAVDLLPLVRTKQSSSADFGLEVVHSRMNPNTTKGGTAYLDDFERAKESHSLSLHESMWHPSHFPFSGDSIVNRPPAWDFYWFRPLSNDSLNKVNKYSIWKKDPNERRITSSDNLIDIFRLHATPGHPDYAQRFENAYASITTSFYRNGLNLERARYFDFLVRPDGAGRGKKGKITIQIGVFNEDQVRNGGPPNGRFDFEDSLMEDDYSKLDKLDKGLDGVRDEREFYLIPKEDLSGWDTLYSGDPRLKNPDDPAGDNYKEYSQDHTENYRFANRTENNKKYDTEDINDDGIGQISLDEKYYSYTIDLDDVESEFIDRKARVVENSGWRFYRIPLKELIEGLRDSVNSPDWRKMGGVRLVWHDFAPENITREHQLLIAEMEIVGNEWEAETGSDSTAKQKIEASSISNQEDSVYFNSVDDRFVRREAGEATPEESSLRLRFSDLLPGDTALVRKNMNVYPQNITGYDSLSLQVHGDVSYSDDVKFIFRFGTDDSTFYEYRGPIRSGWRNEIKISLQELSDMKLQADQPNMPIDTVSPDGRLRIRAPAMKRPNFSSISYMAVGVMRDEDGNLSPVEGELWVNELKTIGSRKLNGWAARTDLRTQWADFMSFSTGVDYTEGDFRTMTQEAVGMADRSDLSGNVNASMKLDKFLPESWGVSIPVGGSVSGSVSRPTIKPNSDVFLLDDDGSPDKLTDMASDAMNMMLGREADTDTTRAERFQTFSTSQNAYTSFSKSQTSKNPLVNLTVDRITTDLSYNMTASQTAKGPHENPDSADYVRIDTVKSVTGKLKYDLSPRDPPSWTVWRPFNQAKWVPALYRNYKLNLLPSTLAFDLADVVHRTEKQSDPFLNVNDHKRQTFDLRHGMRLDYSPFDPLINLSYSVNVERDLSSAGLSPWEALMSDSIVFSSDEAWEKYWILKGEDRRTQSASLRLAPQFFDWLTHTADYSADYTGTRASRESDSTDYINSNVHTSLRFRNTFHLNDFFDEFAKIPALGGVFGWFGKGVKSFGFRSINLDYDVTTDLTNNYLSSSFLGDTADMGKLKFLKYQLGLDRGPDDHFWARMDSSKLGAMDYREAQGVDRELYKNDQATGNWSTRISTSFNLPDPLKIRINNISIGWGREFRARPDSNYIDTTIVFPEIRANASSDLLEKIAFIKTHTSRFKLTSSMNYMETRKELRGRTDNTSSLEFSPLVGVDGMVKKWPISFNYRHSNSRALSESVGKEDQKGLLISKEITERSSHIFNLSYEITKTSGLREIKLFNWVIPVQGKTRMGLEINQNKTERQRLSEEEMRTEPHEGELRYSPYVNYDFTQNVDGEFKYTGSHRTSNGVETNNQGFDIIVRVKF